MSIEFSRHKKLLCGVGSLFISIIVLYLKYLAWNVTNSVAFYSDMLETLINVAAACFGLFALVIADRPADADHTYGHYKTEYLSAIAEGMLVLSTAILIAYSSWKGWQNPVLPHAPLLGILINGSAGIINLFWSISLITTGKKLHSPTLIAGGQHILSDVWTTVGLVSGFAFIPLFGWSRLDSILGFFIALNVLRIGYSVVRDSVNGLMDTAPPPATLELIYQTIRQNSPEAIDCHMLRARLVGAIIFMDFHLVVPGDMSVYHAHQICDRIERALERILGNTSISIHIEPDNQNESI